MEKSGRPFPKHKCAAIFLIVFWVVWHLTADTAAPTASEVGGGSASVPVDGLAVVVNQSNPLTNLTLVELRQICRIQLRHWGHGGKITLALREQGQPEREAVLQQLCEMTEVEFRQYSITAEFKGEILSAPKQLSSALGVQRFVFHVPGAIGFVRANEVDPQVKVLRVEGRLPSEIGYPLSIKNPRSESQDGEHK